VLTLVVVLSLVTFRVTRFVLSDSLIAQPRNAFKGRLLGETTRDAHELDLAYQAEITARDSRVAGWRLKLYELFDCHYCFSVWVSAGAVALTDWQTSVPLPVWMWLAATAGALVIWRFVEE
jgi:hypothetical protein